MLTSLNYSKLPNSETIADRLPVKFRGSVGAFTFSSSGDKLLTADVRIFGSVARKNFDENIDIDFLVNFNSKTSLLDWCNLRLDLEDLLGTKVDVASEKTLKPRIRDRVLEEAINL